MDKIKLAVKKVLNNPAYMPKKDKQSKIKKSDKFDIKKKKNKK